MGRHARLHVPHGTYYVHDSFRQGLEVLAPCPDKSHTPAELQQITRNRRQFEAQLNSVIRRWGARVHAHCWLPDAATMLIQVSLAPLEWVLHSLHGSFSHYLHHEAGIDGRPYPRRYQALLVDSDQFLLDFVRHILCAPVAEGLVSSALAYEHSSILTWRGAASPLFLANSNVPAALAAHDFDLQRRSTEFLRGRASSEFHALLRDGSSHDSRIVGYPAFVVSVHEQSQRVRQALSLAPVMKWAAHLVGVESDKLTNGRRSHHRTLVRSLAAWLMTCSGAASLSEVARQLRCSKSTLHKGIDGYSVRRPDLFNEETFSKFCAFLATIGTETEGTRGAETVPAETVTLPPDAWESLLVSDDKMERAA